MKAIVIGLGSMGKRRIRLINQIDLGIEVIGVDANNERCKEASEKFGIVSCADVDDALKESCDCAFICTAPLSHANLINKCLNEGLHVFTEINLVLDGYEENIALAKEKGLELFLSSTFLYRDEIRYIQKEVKKSKSLLTYSYHVGQYLPDWHPWENYKDYFVGEQRTNGCRELMAIDLPWICKTFGRIKDFYVKKNKKTTLNTTYNDSYILLVEHESGVQGSILVDVVSRKAVRNLEIFGEDLYLTWDGTVDGLKKYDVDNRQEIQVKLYERVDLQEGYAAFVVENAYRNEVEAFLDTINTDFKAEYNFEDDKEILSIINQIEEVQ